MVLGWPVLRTVIRRQGDVCRPHRPSGQGICIVRSDVLGPQISGSYEEGHPGRASAGNRVTARFGYMETPDVPVATEVGSTVDASYTSM